mmetsp:Transcript_54974/g.83204  ORF Transcript_54974/g.83204 Transcript_54974/m.83204 type:complete len:101 (+) Transcript_54974:532-834(+)
MPTYQHALPLIPVLKMLTVHPTEAFTKEESRSQPLLVQGPGSTKTADPWTPNAILENFEIHRLLCETAIKSSMTAPSLENAKLASPAPWAPIRTLALLML